MVKRYIHIEFVNFSFMSVVCPYCFMVVVSYSR